LEARKVRFDLACQPGEMDYLDKGLRQDSPLAAVGSAELVDSTQEIRIQGRFTVRIVSECDRCLEEAVFPVEQEFDLLYRPVPVHGERPEQELDESDADLAFYEGGGLELNNVLREQVLLALPMQRTCRPDCKGICPACGQNRNQAECGCEVRPADDRWAALKNLKQ
jgi:uncharacterized protein